MDKAEKNLEFFVALIRDPSGLSDVHNEFQYYYPNDSIITIGRSYDSQNDTVTYIKYNEEERDMDCHVTFIDYIHERIKKEKIGAKDQIAKGIDEKRLIEESVSYLEFNFILIKDLISECLENTKLKSYSSYIINSLKEIGRYYLRLYGYKLSNPEYYYNCFYDLQNVSYKAELASFSDLANHNNSPEKRPRRSRKVNIPKHFTLKTTPKYSIKERYSQVDDLYDALGEYLECRKNDFRGIFGYGLMKEVPKWKAEINQLYYLINSLERRGFISKRLKWEITIKCFKLDNEDLTTVMLRTTKDPADTSIIDRAILQIK